MGAIEAKREERNPNGIATHRVSERKNCTYLYKMYKNP